MREIISHTPRSFQNDPKEDEQNPQHWHNNKEIWDNNSDAATQKRVELSNFEGGITPGSSISSKFFENNSSFQRFSLLQFNNMMESKDFGMLLQLREKAINYREKTERKIIDKMVQSLKYSPRMLQERKIQLEKWVTMEKEEISNTKNHLLEKWNQTREILEQTEENAKLIKNQLGSVNWSRKASLNNGSYVSENCLDSLNLNFYREEKKSVKGDLEGKEQETGVINFSEPQRLVQSDSGWFGENNSNSVKSLRISVLSNKSEEIDLENKNVDFSKLQKTRDFETLSSLIPPEMRVDRKNHSETFYFGNIFPKLLEETDSGKFQNLDGKVEEVQDNESIEKTDKNKVFEYQQQWEENTLIEDVVKEENKKGIEKIGKDEVDKVIKDENIEQKEEIQQKETSNEEDSIEKVENLNLEDLLDIDNIASEEDSFTQGQDQFSEQINTDFLRDSNKEINQEDIWVRNKDEILKIRAVVRIMKRLKYLQLFRWKKRKFDEDKWVLNQIYQKNWN